MHRLFLFAVATIMTVGPTSNDGYAQSGALLSLYGEGVHEFFGHNYDQASTLIGDAIGQGLRDPRAYYFRGVANYRGGRLSEAQYDFEEGARLEMSSGGGRLIGRSLERIQGPVRLELERYRRDARIRADRQRPRPTSPAPDFVPNAQDQVPEFPPNEDLMPGPAQPEKMPENGAEPSPDAAPVPEPAEPADDDPFSEPADGDDPFGGADDAPPADGDDPFGGSDDAPPAEDDPFGDAENDDPFSWLGPEFFGPTRLETARFGAIQTKESLRTAEKNAAADNSPHPTGSYRHKRGTR